MMISIEGFITLHKNDSYEYLILLRSKLIGEIEVFERKEIPKERWEICPTPDVVYQSNLQYLAALCNLIAERFSREHRRGKDANWLFIIREYLQANGLGYNTSLTEEIQRRKEGKQYGIADHIRGIVYSMLTNQTKWYRVEPHLPEIDKLFFDYDPKLILQTPPSQFYEGLRRFKCGNISTRAQMEALPDNVRTLQKIEQDYGSIDAFITAELPEAIVEKLSDGKSSYKMKMLGEALAWEYLRNVGIDGAKPDTHLRRFLGADRMGQGENSPATVSEVNEQVATLSEMTGLSKIEIDNLIWSFCADGFGAICTADPHCHSCPIRSYCNK